MGWYLNMYVCMYSQVVLSAFLYGAWGRSPPPKLVQLTMKPNFSHNSSSSSSRLALFCPRHHHSRDRFTSIYHNIHISNWNRSESDQNRSEKILSAEKRACTFRAPWWSLHPRLWTRRCKIEIKTLLTKPRDSLRPGFILYQLIATQMIENSPFTHHPSDRSVRTNIRVFFFSWISGKALSRPDHSASCSAGVWQSEPQDYVTAWTSRSTHTRWRAQTLEHHLLHHQAPYKLNVLLYYYYYIQINGDMLM